MDSVHPDEDDIPPCSEDIAKAFPVTLAAMPVSAEDFHGDGSGSDVYIVRTNSLLIDDRISGFDEQVSEDNFSDGDVGCINSEGFQPEGMREFRFCRHLATTGSIIGGTDEPLTIFRGSLGHPGEHGVMTIPRLDAVVEKPLPDYGTADSEGFCERLLALSGEVALDEVVHIQRDILATQVYNLETSNGWYIANDIVTHNCRCVPLPAGIDVEPPQAHIGKRFMTVDEARQLFRDSLKNDDPEDESRVAWLLIRARDENDHWRYLLQQRDDGTWGMPGGTTHVGEDGFHAAFRETTEEIGDLPPLNVVRNFNHTDPDGKQAYLYLCEAGSIFAPQMNGSTPHETAGTGWFRRKEIGDLNLTSKFRGDWEDEVHLERALKMISPSLSGEILVDPAQNAGGGGARWPYPHRADGTEDPLHWQDAGPGAVPDEHGSAGGEPPHDDNFADRVNARGAPEGGKDDEFPRRRVRNKPASRFPDSDPGEGGKYPSGGSNDPGPGAISVGAPKAVPHPVVGSVPAKTPRPYSPRSEPPETFDPAETVEVLTDEGNAVYDLPGARKGASDFTDANPVEAEHVYLQMAKNFPPDAISWIRRAKWIGPIWVPWDRVDQDDRDKWAASHQPAKVKEFERSITAHDGHVAPSVLVQEPNSNRAFIVDGHHRAVARENLKQKVLAYVGNIEPKDRAVALETHAKQIHQGSDPDNK
jgi:8-oxo-dGTP pyrophosphatase MutT (NUDIX family)